MPKSSIARWGATTSAAALALASIAAAYEAKHDFGEVSLVFDTTVSFGASIRTADRESQFLPEGNGGPVDLRTSGIIVPGLNNIPVPTLSGNSGRATYTLNPDNYDGSVNTDDGRLNFDSGDLVGATFKANHDLLVTWQNYKLFARAVGFYDVVMMDDAAGHRSQLTEQALGDVGRNYELLDLFLSADYTIDDLPVNIRVGKQVINWGESTFILNGNNVFNPIDVGAFRRPGSEIKEALIPVNAIYGSVSLPDDISVAAYYALDWEPFELDPSSTPFSTADVVMLGSGIGGNENRVSFLSGSPLSGARRNCTAAAGSGTRAVQTNGLLAGSGAAATAGDPLVSTAGRLDCTDDDTFTGIFANTIDHLVPYQIGRNENVKLGLVRALGNQGYTLESGASVIEFDHVQEADDISNFGLSVRHYTNWLGGIEFGAYFQNYHSRLPFISEVVQGAPSLGIIVNGDSAQATSGSIGARQLLPAGCGYSTGTTLATAGATAAGTIGAINAAGFAGDLANRPVLDPQNLLDPAVNASLGAQGLGALSLTANAAGSYDHILNAMRLNCALAVFQSTGALAGTFFGGATNGLQLVNGAETLQANPNLGLVVEYPEDIEVFGLSFNTTLFGWGVQGDFTYRPEAPFQVDTDTLTIAGVWYGCTIQVASPGASTAIGGPTGSLTFLRTPDGSGIQPQCLPNSGIGQVISGVVHNEMYTAQIGTTATFAQSDEWIEWTGADLGILVTEVGLVYVPGVEDSYLFVDGDPTTTTPQELANRVYPVFAGTGCQGSEVPFGGLLGLDFKTAKQCRPRDFSAGLVMLFRLEYNNAFDTGFVVSPQIAYSYDFEGTTPSPYGNYLEDRQAIGLSITGTLNNNFRVGVSYSDFFGGHINNKAKDQDFASISASYSF
jgi:hypothetical protein